MRIDHVGYAVTDLDRAVSEMSGLGWRFGDPVDDAVRGVRIALGSLDGCCVELVAPLGDGPSPVDGALRKMGPTPYHLCYASDDLEADVDALVERGYKVVSPCLPAVALGGRRAVFLYSLVLGLVELVEEGA